MYGKMLKKDLKRKKTMNIILLLFVTLSVMFMSSSVNNIITVTSGLDSYMEKAGVKDYILLSRQRDGKCYVEEVLEDSEYVEDWTKEEAVFITDKAVKQNGKKVIDFSNASMVMSADGTKLNYFDSDNEIITFVDEGEAYITGLNYVRKGIKPGDEFVISVGETEIKLKAVDYMKDAVFGTEMLGNMRIIVNEKDYEKLASDSSASMSDIYYVSSNDTAKLESETALTEDIIFRCGIDMIKTCYIMDLLVMAIILVMSIGLIAVSFVVLRFTIGFTIAEEFREIGVMKAIGLKNKSVRGLYLVKYFAISVVGAVIGCFAGIPFGNMLIRSSSESMYISNENDMIIMTGCAAAVVAITLLFCWRCTGKINKLSPMDAVRNGQTGERFRKRSIMKLGKSRLGCTGFLSANDVAGNPKQFGIVTVIFTIFTLMVMILSITADTLASNKLLYLLNVKKSDVYYNAPADLLDIMSDSATLDEKYSEIGEKLEENGMKGDIRLEAWYNLPVKSEKTSFSIPFMECRKTDTKDYVYSEGTPPRYENEIALTDISAGKLGVGVGDTVEISIGGEDREFIVTALFQCFNNLGEVGRFHQSVELPDSYITSATAFQIDFDDSPDEKEIQRRIEKMKDIFDTENVFDTKGFVNDCTGVSEILKNVKNFVLLLTILIIVLVTVLMERSFITKEKSEIALMKAIGFNSRSIIIQHTLRFVISVLAAQLIAAAVCIPLTSLIIDPIFAQLGATGHIEYLISPLKQFVLYPLIITAVTVLSVFLTAQYTRTIKASDAANIE